MPVHLCGGCLEMWVPRDTVAVAAHGDVAAHDAAACGSGTAQ